MLTASTITSAFKLEKLKKFLAVREKLIKSSVIIRGKVRGGFYVLKCVGKSFYRVMCKIDSIITYYFTDLRRKEILFGIGLKLLRKIFEIDYSFGNIRAFC